MTEPQTPRLSCLQYGSVTSEQDGLRSRVRPECSTTGTRTTAAFPGRAFHLRQVYYPPARPARSGAGEDEIEFLHEQGESMCFPSLGTQRLRPVARKLLALKPPS